ncbi:MAG: prolyl oligopeptidase family serine peptidase [Firmicutes bacterium]|nr:prolyl oligopeptidase family serine peptidase [Bacillota bacterium]
MSITVDLITVVDGHGQKVVAVALDYGVTLSGQLPAADFSVQARRIKENGETETKPRNISRVYANSTAAMSTLPQRGNYLIIELDPLDANGPTFYFDGESGLTRRYELSYTVTQKREITTADGRTLPSGQFTSTGRINLVVDDFQALVYEDGAGQKLPYQLYVPKGYDPAKKYPLVMFLHGAGERGVDGQVQLEANEGAVIWASDVVQEEHPCFVLAPQCPPKKSWTRREVVSGNISVELTPEIKMGYTVLQQVAKEYSVDSQRIYLTGLSMGGFGTWALGMEYPETFAALVPICGGGDPRKVEAIADKPIWTFHHAGDPVVPVERTRDMVRALEREGEDLYYRPVLYTEYPVGEPLVYGNHSSWVPAYRTKEMRDWLFAQRLGVGVGKVRHISPGRELPDPPFKDGKIPYGFAKTDDIKGQFRDIRYTNGPDSQKLDIYLPDEGEGPFPVMMYIHGGAFFFGSKEMDDLQPILHGLKRGYAVVSINYTLIDCTIGKEIIDQSVYPEALYQAKAAVRWIRANAEVYGFDPERIAVLGTSAGGQIAGLLGTTGHKPETEDLSLGNADFSSQVQAAIICCGANFATPTFLCSAFSTKIENHAHPDGPPILVVHGERDEAIPYEHSVQLVENLREVLGEEKVKFLTLPEAGHNNDPKFFDNDFVDTKNEVYDWIDGVFGITTR